MTKIKLRWLWLFVSATMVLCYPLTVWAADIVYDTVLIAPFMSSWVGVWVFSGAGGIGAGFIIVDEIDIRLKTPRIAKFFIGTTWGVGICLILDGLTSTPLGALTFFALIASSFATPVTAATMIWVGNQKRINKALNQLARRKTGINTDIDEEGI